LWLAQNWLVGIALVAAILLGFVCGRTVAAKLEAVSVAVMTIAADCCASRLRATTAIAYGFLSKKCRRSS
jgi:hypothetical protein